MKQAIESHVKQMLKEYLGEIGYERCGEITLESHLKNDLGMDSLDVYCILMDVEKEYNFNLSSAEEEKVAKDPTVDNLVSVIYAKIK